MGRGRVIGLISGKGGVGKTSLGVNLGVSLSDFGVDVTLVDADFSASNLGVYLGRYEHPVKIQDVLKVLQKFLQQFSGIRRELRSYLFK